MSEKKILFLPFDNLNDHDFVEFVRCSRFVCSILFTNSCFPSASEVSRVLRHKQLQVLSSRNGGKKNFSKLPISLISYPPIRRLAWANENWTDSWAQTFFDKIARWKDSIRHDEYIQTRSSFLVLPIRKCPQLLQCPVIRLNGIVSSNLPVRPPVRLFDRRSFFYFVRSFSLLSLVMSIDVLLLLFQTSFCRASGKPNGTDQNGIEMELSLFPLISLNACRRRWSVWQNRNEMASSKWQTTDSTWLDFQVELPPTTKCQFVCFALDDDEWDSDDDDDARVAATAAAFKITTEDSNSIRTLQKKEGWKR